MTLDRIEVRDYLRRLGIRSSLAPSPESLALLHDLHLQHVPFENASVRFGRPIVLEPSALVAKIVAGGGGFCYELNGAFAALLEAIGYPVTLAPARSFVGADRLGPPFDHLALIVEADGPWLVDVGFGYSFRWPLRLELDRAQTDPMGSFSLARVEGSTEIDVSWLHGDGTWRPHFRFDPTPHRLSDFEPTCWYHRTSPASPFTQGWLCSRALKGGWATLDGRHLVVTSRQGREDRELDDAELATALRRWFGVVAPPGVPVDPPPPAPPVPSP